MRVIAGSARHIPLKTLPGDHTRPTTDRIKETLFNMLQFQLADVRFLDLFSGSGGIGIEALSRGAAEAVFVENNRKAAECIRENLKNTHLAGQARVCPCDVLTAIRQMDGEEPFAFIFMDPPYQEQLEEMVLRALKQSSLVDENTMIIIEAQKETSFDFVKELGFSIKRVKEYKTNKHMFLCMTED